MCVLQTAPVFRTLTENGDQHFTFKAKNNRDLEEPSYLDNVFCLKYSRIFLLIEIGEAEGIGTTNGEKYFDAN
jgi:hypothetical protein